MPIADDGIPSSAVFNPFAYHGAAASILTDPVLDPFGRIPGFKYCAVRVSSGDEEAPIAGFGGGQTLAEVQRIRRANWQKSE